MENLHTNVINGFGSSTPNHITPTKRPAVGDNTSPFSTPKRQIVGNNDNNSDSKSYSGYKGERYLTPNKKRQKVSQISTMLHPTLIDSQEFPTDTEIELSALLNHFPRCAFPRSPPLVLVSQLHSASKDRTTIDRELEQLKNKGTVRLFRLLSGKTDYFVVRMSDYLEKVQLLKEKYSDKVEVFDSFVNNVLPKHNDVYITKDILLRLLYGTKTPDETAITLLVNAELLLNRAEIDSYWFRVPFTGNIVTSLVKGRKGIVSMLKRQKFKELLLSDMKTRKLQYSTLPIDFLVKDMVGLGMLASIDTTAGPLIRLLNEHL